MPRNVRNFWLSFFIDGRGSLLDGGPAGKDGGFDGSILLRDDGDVGPRVRLHGAHHNDGSIVLFAEFPEGAVFDPERRTVTVTTKR